MRLGIVMPVWIWIADARSEQLLHATYKAIEHWKTSVPFHGYVVSNRLHGIEPADLQRELAARGDVRLLHEDGVSRSVAGAWNAGLHAAIADGCTHLLITANDVLCERDCIDRLIWFGEDNPAVPLWSGINTKDRPAIDELAVTEGCDFSCAMLRPATLARFGWFDEEFRQAYFEDNDYVARVWTAGADCSVIHAARFYHHGSLTKQLDPNAAHHVEHWFPINRRRFVEKWGRDPVGSKADAQRLYRR